MRRHVGLLAALAGLASAPLGAQVPPAPTTVLRYAPAPVDNPLKGLVPYAADVRDRFPHSLEFNYLPLAKLVVGEDRYDWAPLEKLLDAVAGRGHQAVFRVYTEYPGQKNAIPQYLLDAGLTVHRFTNDGTNETPDYADPKLRTCFQHLIAALGRKYDGDPRVGFIAAGLLGKWGEWHNYPHPEYWASKEVQIEVLNAYQAAFKVTPVLLRYPAGANDKAQAPNTGRGFGYHDDSFAWATLDTGKPGTSWFFMAAMKAAGQAALDTWRQHPIGGEIRPEAWGKVFDGDPGDQRIQDFAECVRATHATWLMDTGMFRARQPEPRYSRALEQVRKMGYEFHVPAVGVRLDGRVLDVTLQLENRGVAPFYYDWPAQIALLGPGGAVARSGKAEGKLTGLLPGDPVRTWHERLDAAGLAAGEYQLALRVPNPLPKGAPVRFANETQDRDAPGWLTLAAVALP